MHCLEIIIKRNREAAMSQTDSCCFEKSPEGIFWVLGLEAAEQARKKEGLPPKAL